VQSTRSANAIATFNSELERFMARRIGAETTEIKASHVSFISHPNQVVNLIEAAATAAMNSKSLHRDGYSTLQAFVLYLENEHE
jgi:hypothetical protein